MSFRLARHLNLHYQASSNPQFAFLEGKHISTGQSDIRETF